MIGTREASQNKGDDFDQFEGGSTTSRGVLDESSEARSYYDDHISGSEVMLEKKSVKSDLEKNEGPYRPKGHLELNLLE